MSPSSDDHDDTARTHPSGAQHPQRATDTFDPSWAPPSAGTAAVSVPYGTRPGDLTLQWRLLVGAAWVAAFFAYSAVWQASVQIGIGTWWLGPRAQPTNMLVRVLPFVLCIAMALCALYNVTRLLRVSMLGVALAALISVPDFSRSVGLGVAELVIACLVGLVVAAAATGRYRIAPVTSEHADASPTTPAPVTAPSTAPVAAPTDADGH